MDTVAVAAGRYLATITAPAGIAAGVRNMFRDLLRADTTPAGAAVQIRRTTVGYRISVDGRLWDPGRDQTIYDQLVYVLMRASLDSEPDLLHLHAAFVALGGRGLLIAGMPGSGKSTLVARMVADGFDYLTDERVGLDGNLGIHPLPKPLSLVATSFTVLPQLDPRRTGAGVGSPRLWHVPASVIRPDSVLAGADPALLAFVEYRRGAGVSVTEVHPAEAVRLLLADGVDVVRFGAASVSLAAQLCASLRSVRVVFGDDDEVLARVRDLLEAAPIVTRDAVIPVSGARAASSPRLRSGVSGAVVRERAVLHLGSTGEIVELDETVTSWLLLLDGHASIEQIAAEVAEENDLPVSRVVDLAAGMLRHLVELGVVE